MFFRHQKMDDDLKLKSDWLNYTPEWSLGGKCPYQALMMML